MSRGSLRLRLLAVGALSILVALGLAAFGLSLLFQRHVERHLDAELTVYLNQLAANLAVSASGELEVSHPPADPRFAEPISGLYWQINVDPNGKVLRSRSLWDSVLALPPGSSGDNLTHHHLITGPGNSQLYLLQRRIKLPSRFGGGTARIAAAWNAEEIQKSVRNFASELVPFLLLIGALLIAASWAQVSIGLRPLAAVREKLSAIRSGRARRMEPGFPDEVQPLADEIDALLDQRQAAIEKAKGRAADLAHGFKTPLQILHGEVERLREKGETTIASDISSLAEVMRRHVDRELTRARLSYSSGDASANVKTVMDRVVRVVERMPEGLNLHWSVDIRPEFNARIDPDDLAEVLGNLIENAARHAKERISVSASADDEIVSIVIADDGPGIAEEQWLDVMERGRRLDTKSEGAGLGLAIAQEILEACGGYFSFGNEGPGLQVAVHLRLCTDL